MASRIYKFVIVVCCFCLSLFAACGTNSDNQLQAGVNVNSLRLSNSTKPNATDKTIEKIPTLQTEADQLLSLFDSMPQVPVFVKDAPVLKKGSNVETGVAYTDCLNKTNPTIYIKRVFYEKANRKQIINILKHEMTHAFFCRQGIQAAHDERFRRKFKQVGGFGN